MNWLHKIYLAIWTRMFGDIFGWSEQETLDWAKRYDQYLQDPDDIMYHEDPPYWAVDSFVPQSLNERLSPDERCVLRNDLLAMFGVRLYLTDYLDVDWKRYESQINLIIEKHEH